MKYKVPIIFNIILLFYGIYVFHGISELLNYTLVSICMLICIIQFIMIEIDDFRHLFRPVTLILFSYLIVNCQLYIDLIIGNISPTDPLFVNQNLINRGALLSAISFTAFSIGYFMTKAYKVDEKKKDLKYNKYLYRTFAWGSILLFIIWISGLSVKDFTGEAYLESSTYNQSRKYYVEILLQTFILLTLSYGTLKEKMVSFISFLNGIPKLFLASMVAYLVIKLMTGDRGPIIYTFFLLVFAYVFQTKRRIPLLVLIIAFSTGIYIMNSIRLGRKHGSDITFKEKLWYAYNNESEIEYDNSFSPFTLELASSNLCTNIALDQIHNKEHTFFYGTFHMCYLLKSIPFLGTKLVNDYLNIPSSNQSSSEFVTVIFYGPLYLSGLGTTTIADEYLEFGLWGVVLSFLFLGFVFKKVDSCILDVSPKKISSALLLAVFTMCYGAFYIPRGIFFMYFRTWLYAYFAFYLVKVIITHYEKK